jgi:beta-lactamase class A
MSRLALATATLVGITVGIGAVALWAGVPQSSHSAVVTSAVAPLATIAPKQLEPTPTETLPELSTAPPAVPTIIPAPISVATAATGSGPLSTVAPQALDTPRASATSLVLLNPATPVVVNARVKADIEAAMQAIVPNGSAELIAQGGSLIARHRATESRTAASTIKLALLIELLNEEQAGHLDLSKKVTVQAKNVVAGTGDLQYQVGRTLTLNELAHQMIIKSDNVAANILVDIVGMANVNKSAQANNFPNTFFRRHMLDIAAEAAGVENVTSAEDLAGMMHHIVRGEMISPTVSQQAVAYLDERGRLDKNWLGLNLPAGAQLAHINGTLDTVRNDVGLITSPSGKSFVLAICQDHLASDAAGEAAIATLARRVYDIFEAA